MNTIDVCRAAKNTLCEEHGAAFDLGRAKMSRARGAVRWAHALLNDKLCETGGQLSSSNNQRYRATRRALWSGPKVIAAEEGLVMGASKLRTMFGVLGINC